MGTGDVHTTQWIMIIEKYIVSRLDSRNSNITWKVKLTGKSFE